MSVPDVADLWCDSPLDCCEPQGLTLQDIADDVFVWFALGNYDLNGAPGGTTSEMVSLLLAYTKALRIAQHRLGHHACMAKHVGGCRLVVSVCVEEANCNCSNPCAVNQCDRPTVMLDELAEYVSPQRIASVSIDGTVIAFNEEPAEAGDHMLTTHRTWQLSGPNVETGGTFQMLVTTKDPSVEWEEAVKSLTCTLVPGSHSEDCKRENPEFGPPPGFLNNEIADALDSSCHMPALRFGAAPNIRAVKWEATPA